MSQSRFSIVLVGVSALLRRPLVSRLRPADGERSPWVVFAARRCLPLRSCRSGGWPSGSRLPLFGMRRFGVALGELAFGLTASAFRHAPLRGCPRRVGSSASRFGDCHSAGWCFRSASWPSGSRLPLFGTHRFGVAARWVGSAAFRFGVATRRVGLRAHHFRFSARTASGLPLGGLVLPPSASAFAARRVGASAFRFGVALGGLVLLPAVSEIAAQRGGLRAHRFRFSARTDPHRRTADARADGAHRHDNCFTSKHLSQHVNLPHRTP